jgi:RNA polymerase sigma factor (sigma-70 family)
VPAAQRDGLAAMYQSCAEAIGRLARLGCQVRRADGQPAGRVWLDEQDCPDLVQEVFVKAATAVRGPDPTGELQPYLLMIARNTMIDWLRRRAVAARVRAAAVELWPDRLPERAPWEDPRSLAAAERYLAELPATLAGIYRLRFVEGLRQSQAARRLGISRQSFRTLERRLRDGLQATLEGVSCDAPCPRPRTTTMLPRRSARRR